MAKNFNSNAMTTKDNTLETIDFEKDFANHMKELTSEIAGLHNNGLTYTDELETLLHSRDLIQNGAFTNRRKGGNLW
jgi:hypothetical protein